MSLEDDVKAVAADVDTAVTALASLITVAESLPFVAKYVPELTEVLDVANFIKSILDKVAVAE